MLLLLPLLVSTTAEASGDSRDMQSTSVAQFSYKNNVVTARFQNAPLRKVLQLISDSTGVSFQVDKGVDGKITRDIDGLPLDEALLRILQPYNRAFVFDKINGRIQLVSVSILRKGGESWLLAQYDRINASESAKSSTSKPDGLSASTFAGSTATGKSSASHRVMASGKADAAPGTAKGYGRLMQAIGQTQKSISLLQHKMGAERQHFQKQEAILKGQLALANDASKPGIVKQLRTLEAQSIRARQSDVQMLMNEQRNLRQLMALRAVYRSPSQQKLQWIARQNRQHAAVRVQQQRWGR